jgi:CheY-like chemotaxis protein
MKGAIAAVLVVEDDPLLLELAVEVVLEAGLEPIAATTADEALAILRVRADDVRLVFTDIQMPGSMDGLRLAHAVRKGWPPVALIVTSGRRQIGTNDLPVGGRFIAKPYDATALSQVFREMVGAGG